MLVDLYYLVKRIKPSVVKDILRIGRDVTQVHQALHGMLNGPFDLRGKKSWEDQLAKATAENKNFKYHKEEELSTIVGDHSFNLPLDDLEVLYAGNLLDICVYSATSYRADVRRDVCRLVMVRDKNKCILTCMEIRGNRVYQAKTYFNRHPKDELKRDIIAYCELNGLKWDKCGDLTSGDYSRYAEDFIIEHEPDQDFIGIEHNQDEDPQEMEYTPEPLDHYTVNAICQAENDAALRRRPTMNIMNHEPIEEDDCFDLGW
jgi:hypothetical protein